MERSAKKYAVIAFCILGANLVASDGMSDTFDETPKCMPPEHTIETMLNCYKTITGTEFDPSTTKSSHLSADVKVKIMFCISQKYGIVNADGKTFNVEKAVMAVSFLEADDATKTVLKNDFQDCGTKSGDAESFVTCTHEAFMKDCK